MAPGVHTAIASAIGISVTGFVIDPTLGLVIVALIGLAGIALKVFGDAKATRLAREVDLATAAKRREEDVEDRRQAAQERADALRALDDLDKKTSKIEVNVDGKLDTILELHKKLEFARGKEAGKIEEIAAAAAVAVVPAVIAAAIPEVLPTVVKLVVESVAVPPREGTEPAPAPAEPPAVLNLNVQPTAPTDLDVGAKEKKPKP